MPLSVVPVGTPFSTLPWSESFPYKKIQMSDGDSEGVVWKGYDVVDMSALLPGVVMRMRNDLLVTVELEERRVSARPQRTERVKMSDLESGDMFNFLWTASPAVFVDNDVVLGYIYAHTPERVFRSNLDAVEVLRHLPDRRRA